MTSFIAVLRSASREAIGSIAGHPLRASLATVAMAAAVATTAVVQTGLDGLARSAREASARAFGSDSFVIAKVATGNLSRRELADKLARNPDITRSDGRFIERLADSRVIYAATAQRQADVSARGRRFENATLNGTQAALFEIRDLGIVRGRGFNRVEENQAAQIVVIGHAIGKDLFGAQDPLDQLVRIAGRGFRIIGIQAPQGTAGGVTLDRYVWMPIGAYERTFGAAPTLQVFAAPPDAARTTEAEDQARVSMRARRRLGPGEADTFDIITPEASRTFVAAVTQRVGAAGPPISLMALLAAGVVIANTTLVSVAQRTREIGIRRAVGAARSTILVETLAESALLATAGGILGLTAAGGVLWVASQALDTRLALEWTTALASLFAASASGIAAGWFPARRAAALEVVAALAQES
jgi:putative ABC transport system permease protein